MSECTKEKSTTVDGELVKYNFLRNIAPRFEPFWEYKMDLVHDAWINLHGKDFSKRACTLALKWSKAGQNRYFEDYTYKYPVFCDEEIANKEEEDFWSEDGFDYREWITRICRKILSHPFYYQVDKHRLVDIVKMYSLGFDQPQVAGFFRVSRQAIKLQHRHLKECLSRDDLRYL